MCGGIKRRIKIFKGVLSMYNLEAIIIMMGIIMILGFVRFLIAIKRLLYYEYESKITHDESGNLLRREFTLKDGNKFIFVGGMENFPRSMIEQHGKIIKCTRL